MKIPNVDGIYKRRDGSLTITVTRKEIVITGRTPLSPPVHYIDDSPVEGPARLPDTQDEQAERISKSIRRGIKFINDSIL